AAHVDDADRAVMARDELETFDRPIRECNFHARETVLSSPAPAAIKLFRFLFVAPGVAERLARARAALLGRALSTGGAGYVLNLAADSATGAGLGCAAIDEITFASVEAAQRVLMPGLIAELIAAETSIGVSAVAVLTRETVLYQAKDETATPG